MSSGREQGRDRDRTQMWHPRDLGESAEGAVFQLALPLRPVASDESVVSGSAEIDAVTTAPLRSSRRTPFAGTALLETGTPVEIKSVAVVTGEAETRGRFLLRKQQHEALLSADGAYLFAVCEPRRERHLIATKVVAAGLVDDLVGTWTAIAGDRSEEATTKLAWSVLFRADRILEGAD